MIISASRRTDIPAFFGEWFMRRIREGFAYARNPFNPHSVSRIPLDPAGIECIVFWTKNAQPFLSRLTELEELGYSFYFLHTLNPYGQDLEPGLPGMDARIRTFLELSERVGPDRAVWRYDPVFLGRNVDIAFHIERFGHIAARLAGRTETCVISFLDMYRHIRKQSNSGHFRELLDEEIVVLAGAMGEIAAGQGMRIQTCCESVDLARYGIARGACIDGARIERIRAAKGLSPGSYLKDRNQRQGCGCVRSVDIGAYDTCAYGCVYCYASMSQTKIEQNQKRYSPDQALLCADITEDLIITERKDAGRGKDWHSLWD